MSTELATRPTASASLAAFIGMEPRMMLDTIKAQCFKCDPSRVSDAQLAAFVSIAHEMRINPLLPGMLWAYPTQNGIVPMIGPDGMFKKLAEHPDVDSWETTVYPEDVTQPPTHATTKVFRKGTERPLLYTAVLSEWKIASNPNWNSRPRHMLALRSLKQCARQIIHGIPLDEDERVISDAINVTPEEAAPAPAPTRPAPPPRAKKGAAAVAENAPATRTTAPEVVVEVASETVATPPPEPAKPEPAPEPAKEPEPAAPAPEKPAEAAKSVEVPNPVQPRAFLNDNEQIECIVRVKEVKSSAMKSGDQLFPTTKASVTGGFVGDIYHKGGAKESATAGVYEALPPWKAGAELKVTLLGQKNARGNVINYVQKVEEVDVEF